MMFPGTRTVLDIGGQDTKVIALGENGRVADFEMNDKCAAGTGKFLEVMAGALGFTLSEMAEEALVSALVTERGVCRAPDRAGVDALLGRDVAAVT